MGAAARIIAMVSVFSLGGCSLQQSGAKILVSDGCVVTIEGISTVQAQEIMKSWDIMDDCRVRVKTGAGHNE